MSSSSSSSSHKLNATAAFAFAFAFSALMSLASAQNNSTAPQGACTPTQGGPGACGPNGSEEWLNTGLESSSGWQPPFLDINSISHISLDEYYSGAGQPCEQYDEYFQNSGNKYGIDPAILAFIAMQESSCNADAGGPTPGLMQCAPENCYDGSGAEDCQYPVGDNVDCGAYVLKQALDGAGGNAVHALGTYNGWFTKDDWAASQNNGKGLTEDYPCGAGVDYGYPQNLDYVHELLNGWFQGYDIYGDDADKGGYYECQGSCDSGVC